VEGMAHICENWKRGAKAETRNLQEYRPKLAEHVVDAVQFISDAQRSNKKILIEGANALMASYRTYAPRRPAGLDPSSGRPRDLNPLF